MLTARTMAINPADGLDQSLASQPDTRMKRTSQARQSKRSARRWVPPSDAPRRLLTLPEAAAYLGVSPWTVRELQWSGKLPRVDLGRKLLFDRADLDALIERQKDCP